MAEEPIRKEDILDDSAIVSINDLIKALERLDKVFNQLHADTKDKAISLFNSVQGVNPASPEGQTAMKNFISQAEQLQIQSKEENKLLREKTKLQEKLKTLYTDEASDVAKLRVAIENKNKANKVEAQYVESAEGSINKMRAKLKELTAEYNKLAPAARDKVAPAINKLSAELKKAEGAIGNNTRSVGSYKQAILAAGKQVLAFTGITGLGVAALTKLKDAFKSTETGMSFTTKTGLYLKQVFYELSETLFNWSDSYDKSNTTFKELKQIGEKQAEIRKEDIKDITEISRMEKNIAQWRYKSTDAMLSQTEQSKWLKMALEEEDRLIKFKVDDLTEELQTLQDIFKVQRNNLDLAQQIAEKQAEIDAVESDRNIRLLSRSSGIEQKKKDDLDKWLAAIEEQNKKEDDAREKKIQEDNNLYNLMLQYTDEYFTNEEKRVADAKEKEWETEMDFARKREESRRALAKQEWEQIQEEEKRKQDLYEETERKRQAIVDESFSIVSSSISSLGDLYQTQKENELSAAGDNAKKREEIERNYAKKQQALQVGQALIDGAATIVSIWRKWAPISIPLAQLFSALSAATTIAQVAIIKSQKFAKGGSGVLFGPTHSSGGINVGIGEAEGGEHIAITSRKMTSRYGAKMLDAVSNSINQGKFFEVWANVNKEMGVSDPYTKKMYDLMTKTPTVYTDTNGNTVKEYPNGQKYVIKKFWNN